MTDKNALAEAVWRECHRYSYQRDIGNKAWEVWDKPRRKIVAPDLSQEDAHKLTRELNANAAIVAVLEGVKRGYIESTDLNPFTTYFEGLIAQHGGKP